MPARGVTLFRDLAEDRRSSMEMYANNLAQSLAELGGEPLDVRDYRPTIPQWVHRLKAPTGAKVRYARYVSYPAQARRRQSAVNHIIDQSYGHLLWAVDHERTVVTVHDLIPLLAWHGLIPGVAYPHYPALFKVAVAGLRRARFIIAVSASTKRDLIRHAGIPEYRIVVIHHGVDRSFTSRPPAEREALRSTFRFPDRRQHVVLISGSQRYKNVRTSLRVVARLQQRLARPVQLAWLGADDQRYPEERSLTSPVIRIRGLPSNRLTDLYNCVDCLLFPSLYEGFGWPPLEAMACGTPVVASNAASLPEVVGDAAMTARPDDVEGLADGVASLLEDESVRHEFIRRGLENAKRFNWQRNAAAVREVYRRIEHPAR